MIRIIVVWGLYWGSPIEGNLFGPRVYDILIMLGRLTAQISAGVLLPAKLLNFEGPCHFYFFFSILILDHP